MAVYAASGWTVLAGLAGVVAAFGGLIWLSLQVARSRLLGGAVHVSETTLPELQAVFNEVRSRLNYRKHVDVYVMDKVDGGSVMTSYLGTRLILIEGGLVADLLGEEHHAELTYLIGRHIGQLKARHQRLLPILLVISLVDSLKLLQLFLAPYYRATAKSGDQIAAACCGDIRATAAMMNRLLAGKELGPRLAVKGVLDQAAVVRRRWLPRLAQLVMSEPHATNRYLNLLAFFARVAPEEIGGWRASLDEATASRLTAAIEASPNRRAPRRRTSSAIGAAGDTGQRWIARPQRLADIRRCPSRRQRGQRREHGGVNASADRRSGRRFLPAVAHAHAGELRRDVQAHRCARGQRLARCGCRGRLPAGSARWRWIRPVRAFPEAGCDAERLREPDPRVAAG